MPKKPASPKQSAAYRKVLRQVMSDLGRLGGQVKGRKGFAAISKKRAAEIRAKGLTTRRANSKKRAADGKA